MKLPARVKKAILNFIEVEIFVLNVLFPIRWLQDVNSTYVRRSEDVQDIF